MVHTHSQLNVKLLSPSPELLRALIRAALTYSSATDLYEHIDAGDAKIGVFGDGSGGCYEWFIFRDDQSLTHSDVGYGSTEAALRGLMKRWLLDLPREEWSTGEREQFLAEISGMDPAKKGGR